MHLYSFTNVRNTGLQRVESDQCLVLDNATNSDVDVVLKKKKKKSGSGANPYPI